MHTILQTGHNGTMMKKSQIKITCRVVFTCLSVTSCCLNESAFGLFRWPRTCLTMPNWTGWDTWLWCRLPTCSWRISGCSVVRTSNGPSMLWRDTMQSHERYPWSCRPLCLLRMLLQVSHFFVTFLLSFTNVSLNSHTPRPYVKLWRSGKIQATSQEKDDGAEPLLSAATLISILSKVTRLLTLFSVCLTHMLWYKHPPACAFFRVTFLLFCQKL